MSRTWRCTFADSNRRTVRSSGSRPQRRQDTATGIKGAIIAAGLALGVDYSLTVSCYQATPEGLACGKCDSCRLRRQGFIDAGVQDPTRYLSG